MRALWQDLFSNQIIRGGYEMIEIMSYKGKEIYYLDASDQTTQNIQEIRKDMDGIKRLIRSKPPKSALMITNVTNVRFNREMTELFKE